MKKGNKTKSNTLKEGDNVNDITKSVLNLNDVLDGENINWQKMVYDELGVYCTKFNSAKTALVYSPCGFTSVTYKDKAEDTYGYVINSISDLISTIRGLEEFPTVLMDCQIATFMKSELFAAIYHQILLDNCDPDYGLIIGLASIDVENRNDGRINLEFEFSVCGVDSLNIGSVEIGNTTSLNETLNIIAAELKYEWIYAVECEKKDFKYTPDAFYKVPTTYEELVTESKHYAS